MTDTTILDGLMAALERNPLVAERLRYPLAKLGTPNSQYVETDARPMWARREVVPTKEMNRRYAERIDLFHQGNGARLERPRLGTCRSVKTIERHIDGEIYRREEVCGGIVHAVETKMNGAVRVDGKCLSCGWELHRAGLLEEKGE